MHHGRPDAFERVHDLRGIGIEFVERRQREPEWHRAAWEVSFAAHQMGAETAARPPWPRGRVVHRSSGRCRRYAAWGSVAGSQGGTGVCSHNHRSTRTVLRSAGGPSRRSYLRRHHPHRPSRRRAAFCSERRCGGDIGPGAARGRPTSPSSAAVRRCAHDWRDVTPGTDVAVLRLSQRSWAPRCQPPRPPLAPARSPSSSVRTHRGAPTGRLGMVHATGAGMAQPGWRPHRHLAAARRAARRRRRRCGPGRSAAG